MTHALTNSSYILNTTDLHSVLSSDENEKLSKAFAYVKHGGCHGAIHFTPRHKETSPYNFNMQFPIYTKFITHLYHVALKTSMHQ